MKTGISKIIVGFKIKQVNLDDTSKFASSEQLAHHVLSSVPNPGFSGYKGVIRRLKYLNAVVVEVKTQYIPLFIKEMQTFDPVEYCDQNHRLRKAGYGHNLPSSYRLGRELPEIFTKHHITRIDQAHPYGVGARVALIDSGISAHPYLPSLCASELRLKISTMHESIPRKSRTEICDLFESAQRAAGVDGIGLIANGISRNKARTKNTASFSYTPPPIRLHLDTALQKPISDAWDNWKKDVSAWFSRRRSGPRPEIPIFRHIYGTTRIISPLSRSFLDDPTDINDVDGHGTQMAGIISALRPVRRQTVVDSEIRCLTQEPLLYSSVGISPFSELVILKCFHQLDEDDEESINGGLLNMIDALTYAIDQRLEIIYIGLALIDGNYTAPVSATNLLLKLHELGAVVIAPAGNGGNSTSLSFPASFLGVNAVTSVKEDPIVSNLVLSSHSSIADPGLHQEVTFSAYGGDADDPLVTLEKGSGFASVWGTSVASAIATGVIAANRSKFYTKHLKQEYAIQMQSGLISPVDVQQHITSWCESEDQLKQLKKANLSHALSIQGSSVNKRSNHFGVGLSRVFDDASTP